MSEVAIQRFGCDGCGKQYPWKPELTNKKAKCKCGSVITVPDLSVVADDPPPLPDDGIFDFIDNAPEVESAQAAALRAAAMPVAIPVAQPAAKGAKKAGAVKSSQVLGYRQGPTQRDRTRASQQFETMHDMTRDVWVPTGLIVASFAAFFVWLAMQGANSSASLGMFGGGLAIMLGVKTVCMIIGAFIVSSMAGVSFGPFSTAILKLAAVAIAPDMLATIIEDSIGVPGAFLIANSVALGFYWFLISYLFSMDASEAWGVVVLFGFLRFILTFVLGMLLVGMLMSGRGSALGGSGGSTPTASEKAVELGENVEAWKENDTLIEGLDYIQKTGRQSACQQTIKDLYAAGSPNVWFNVAKDINGKTEPLSLIAQWPRDAKKRGAMIDAIKQSQVRRQAEWKKIHPDFPPLTMDPVTDEGGKYVELPIGG